MMQTTADSRNSVTAGDLVKVSERKGDLKACPPSLSNCVVERDGRRMR